MQVFHPTADIHPTAVIGPNVTIGKGVYIGPFCIIGFPPEWRGKEHIDYGVSILDGAILTGHVTVDSGAESRTVIGERAYLMKHCHVGHDSIICDRVTISCGAKIGGHAVIKSDANIGLNAVIHQKQVIAPGVMIGMGAVVPKSLKTEPYKIYAGNPARFLRDNDSHPNYIIFQKEFPSCE